MPYVDEEWLADNASHYVRRLDEIVKPVEGAEPTDGSVSGDEYRDAREFINAIEDASEALHDAYIEVVDKEEIRDPSPFIHYKAAHEKLEDVAYREVPDVPGRWRTEFDNAKADLQDVVSKLPKP